MASGGTSGAIVTIFTSLFIVAIVAVIVSQRANTAKILQALGASTGGVIGAAVSPITGGGGSSGGGSLPTPTASTSTP